MEESKHQEYHYWTQHEIEALLTGVARVGTDWNAVETGFLPDLSVGAIKNKFYKMVKRGEIAYRGGLLSFHADPQVAGASPAKPTGAVGPHALDLHRRKLQREFDEIRNRVRASISGAPTETPALDELLDDLKCLFDRI